MTLVIQHCIWYNIQVYCKLEPTCTARENSGQSWVLYVRIRCRPDHFLHFSLNCVYFKAHQQQVGIVLGPGEMEEGNKKDEMSGSSVKMELEHDQIFFKNKLRWLLMVLGTYSIKFYVTWNWMDLCRWPDMFTQVRFHKFLENLPNGYFHVQIWGNLFIRARQNQ